MPKPCGFYHRNLTVLQTETLRVLDSAPTYCEAIRVHAYSESYASRLGIHVWRQKVAFQKYKTFNGYLNSIFTLNPSIDNYFIESQLKSGYKPQLDLDFLNFNNIFKLEVARCKLGRAQFKSWIDEFNHNESLRVELGIQSRHKLTVRQIV